MRKQQRDDRVVATIRCRSQRRNSGAPGQVGISAFAQQQVDRVCTSILGGLIKRRGSGEVAGVDCRAALQEQLDQGGCSCSGCVGQRHRAKAIARLERSVIGEQTASKLAATIIRRCEQHLIGLNRCDLRLDQLELDFELAAGVRGRRGCLRGSGEAGQHEYDKRGQ